MSIACRLSISVALLLGAPAASAQTPAQTRAQASSQASSQTSPAVPAPSAASTPKAAAPSPAVEPSLAEPVPVADPEPAHGPEPVTAAPPAPPSAPKLEPSADPYSEPNARLGDPYAGVPRRSPPPPLSRTRGFAAALQIGYSGPTGSATDVADDELARTFGSQVSLWGEMGARVTPALFLGVYAGYGFGGVGSALDQPCANLDCSSSSERVGLAIRYRFFPGPHVQTWIGYAAGYEVASLSLTNGKDELSATLTGWEYAHLSAGLDYSDGELFAVGPVVDIGFGQYDHVKSDSSTKHVDQDITQTATHEWMTIGLRVTLMP